MLTTVAAEQICPLDVNWTRRDVVQLEFGLLGDLDLEILGWRAES